MVVQVLSGQNLLDIAVQAAGSVEAVLEIAAANGMSITDTLKPGTILSIPQVADRQVADYYAANALKPATGNLPDNIGAGGIGYMAIGVDFVVS